MRPGDSRTAAPRAEGARNTVRAADRGWPARMRAACAVSATALGVTVLLDGLDGTLSLPRTLAWVSLAAMLFTVLLPPRVTAGEGWLAVRDLLRTRRVRTDHLVSVRVMGAFDRRLLLRDAFGGRVALDPAVLVANPFLWHRLDTGARRAHAAGLLLDRTPLVILAETIDASATRTLLTEAGLTEPSAEA